MTDHRYNGGCANSGSSSSGSSSSNSSSSNSSSSSSSHTGNSSSAGNTSKPSPVVARGGPRCHKTGCAAVVRRPTGAATMHVKKTWKNAAVMLLAVAAVTTATAAFYFNYAATACCLVAQTSSSWSAEPFNPAGAAVDDQPDRARFSSSVLHASKMYLVCKTHGYRRRAVDRDRLYRSRRQLIDSTTLTDKSSSSGVYNENSESGDNGRRNGGSSSDNTTLIYFITPTYPRREQIAELTRLGQTLMLVPRIHWIVADDRADCSPQVTNLLPDFSIPYTYIASPMPAIYKRKSDAIPRGVSNRRAALNWIRLNHDANNSNAVIYFGDDDNTFHLDLFKEIRSTKKISMFPVGLVGEYGVSSPIIDKGKVVGFFDSWPAKRKFPVDMAGFAINVQLIFKYPYATMPYKAGFEEDRFLSALSIQLDEIEPKAENCTKILVWHTQTVKKPKPIVMVRSKSTLPGSLTNLLDQVAMLGIGEVSETTGVRSYMTKHGNIFKL